MALTSLVLGAQITMSIVEAFVFGRDFCDVRELVRIVLLYFLEEVFELLNFVHLPVNSVMLVLQGLQL